MFYLRNLGKIFKKSPLLLSIYFAIAAMTPAILLNSSKISSYINKASKQEISSPFFHALIDKNQNYSRYSRKLRSLPGVKDVEVLSPEKMEEQAKKIIGELDVSVASDLLNVGYAGIKVIFDTNIKAESMELVRDYLKRLVGDSSITIGELIKSSSEKIKDSHFAFIFKNLNLSITVSIILLWIVANFLFAKIFNNEFFIIQNFQRTKNIPIKLYLLTAAGFIFIPFTIASIFSFSVAPALYVVVAIILGSLPHLKNWQWISR